MAKGMRGHSSLIASLDAAIEVNRKDKIRTFTLAKSNDGKRGITHSFNLKSVYIGNDEDFEPVYSCVVEPAEADTKKPPKEKPKEPTGKIQKPVYRWLKENPPIGGSITLADLIEAMKGRIPVEDEKRVPERVRDAVSAMVNAGHLNFSNNEISFPVSLPKTPPSYRGGCFFREFGNYARFPKQPRNGKNGNSGR